MYNGNANDNDLNSSQSERGRQVSLGTGRMYTNPFNVTSNYINKVNIIYLVMIDIFTTVSDLGLLNVH